MKKFIILFVCAVISTATASAQKGAMTIGGNLLFATENSAVGIGAKYQYNLTDPVRLAGSFNYFFEKDCLKNWDLNIDAHYLVNLNNGLHVYPLAGLTYSSWTATVLGYSATSGKFGANLGAGAQYDINPLLSLSFEGKAQLINDFTQGVFTFGISYRFK